MGIKMFKTDLFPYIDGLSLIGKKVNQTMSHVNQEKLPNGKGGEEMKYVLYFKETKKGLVLNKTNVKRIIKIAGSDDTDDWKGKTICLYAEKVKAFGETHDAVRVSAPIKGAANRIQEPTAAEVVAASLSDDEFNAALFDTHYEEPPAEQPALIHANGNGYGVSE